MARPAPQHGADDVPTFTTSYTPGPQRTPSTVTSEHDTGVQIEIGTGGHRWTGRPAWQTQRGEDAFRAQGLGSTGKGILIGMMSAFGSAALVALIVAIVYFFRNTNRGRIFLDRMSRPGEFDDEQQFLREEEEALAEMDDLQQAEYHRAKGG